MNLKPLKWLFLLTFSLSCFSGSISKPGWVEKTPRDNLHWYGKSQLYKPLPENYYKTARQRAEVEIASQISVEVQSSLINVLTGNNENIDRFSQSIIKSRVEKTILPNVEYDDWEDEDTFNLLGKVKRKTYYDRLDREMAGVLNTAQSYLKSAQKQFDVNSFISLGNAWKTIEPFIDRDKIGFNQTIKENLESYLKRVVVEPSVNSIKTKVFQNNRPIQVTCFDRVTKQPIKNIPLAVTLNKNNDLQQISTDGEGKAFYTLPKIKDKSINQYVTFTVDIFSLIDSSASLLAIKNPIHSTLQLEMNTATAKLISEEKIFGKKLEEEMITPALKDLLTTQLGMTFKDDGDTDYSIKLSINTSKSTEGKNEYGFFVAFADLALSIIDNNTNLEILSTNLTQIKGAHFNSYELAGKEAIKIISEKYLSKTVQKMIDEI